MIEEPSSPMTSTEMPVNSGVMIDVNPQAPWLSLRQLREAQGVHIALLSAQLKVSQQTLQALEEGRFDALPGGSFARTLASNVCRHLKVDPAPLLAAWPKSQSGPLAPPSIVAQHSVRMTDSHIQAQRQRRWAWGVGATALVIAVWIWFVPPLGLFSSNRLSGQDSAAVASGPTDQDTPSGAPVVLASGSSASVDGTADLAFRASEKSWVEIKREDGTVVFANHLMAGQTQTVRESLPLVITIGNAAGVTMMQGGSAFDIQPHVQQNVARFEVR